MIRRILNIFLNTRFVRRLNIVANKISLPGFEGHSLYEVAAFFYRGINQGSLQLRAAAMAYSFFLALFPTLIFLFTLIPYIPSKELQPAILKLMEDMLPENAFAILDDTIHDIVTRGNSGLLSFGFLAALYFSTNGFSAMINGFNASVHVFEKRTLIKQQGVSFIFVFLLTVALVVMTTVLIYSEYWLKSAFERPVLETIVVQVGRWMIIGFILIALIGTFYRLGPAARMSKYLISPGSLLAAFLILLTTMGFAWYVDNFGNYNKLYGSIGTVIVLLILINWISMMLLIGFELDAGIASARAKAKSLLEQQEAQAEKSEESEVI
jgi:membrane protein